MRFRSRIDRQVSRRRVKRNSLRPTIELFEPKVLLSDGFVQGFATNAANAPLAGAIIELINPSNNSYITTTTNSEGYYGFNNVAPGTYDVSELAPGYTPALTTSDVQTTINPAGILADSNNTEFQVTVVDPTSQNLGLEWTGNWEYDYVNEQLNASAYNQAGASFNENGGAEGQLQLKFLGNSQANPPYNLNPGNISEFESFCSDLQNGVYQKSPFTVQPSLLPNTTTLPTADPSYNYSANLGEIGYLYNNFGIVQQANDPNSETSSQAAGLQLALWALEYNQMPASGAMTVADPDTPLQVNTTNPPPAGSVYAAANAFLSDAYSALTTGNSEDAYFLNLDTTAEGEGVVGGTAGQGMFCTDLLNFTNEISTQSSPSITTTPSTTAVTLGTSSVTLNDTATLSNGNAPTGTITFTLYEGTTLLDTETTSVNGNGDYTTPTGYTLPTTGTVTGTYQWDASYSGDTNNSSATDNGASDEQVTVSAASPAIATTPSVTTVTLGTSAVTLSDTASLTGGYNETGTITFTLYQGATEIGTPQTVSVSGDGSYASPGITLPTTGTVIGTYQWDASYSGDSNNAAVSETNATAEQVVVSPASPAIATTPSVTSVTLGTSTVTLSDTASLTGGYDETGTITFTLYQGATEIGTPQTVSVSGDGSYASPGITLPTTGTVTGTYQWDASYSGDSNNAAVSETNATAEQVVVSPASPALTTTPGGTVAIGTTTISGTKYLDTNGDGFGSGNTPEAGVTIDLFKGSSPSGTAFESTTTAANGTYSFSNLAPGTYSVEEVVPTGYIQTGGGPNGTAGNTYYTVNAVAGESYSGYNFDDFLIPTCTPTNVTYTVTEPCGKVYYSGPNLAGNTQQGDTVTVSFTVTKGMSDQLTLVSYVAPTSSFSDSNAYEQEIYQYDTATFRRPGTPVRSRSRSRATITRSTLSAARRSASWSRTRTTTSMVRTVPTFCTMPRIGSSPATTVAPRLLRRRA